MDRKRFLGDSLKLGVGLSLSPVLSPERSDDADRQDVVSKKRVKSNPRVVNKVIVAGAGIAGLTCAYELMKKGHEVVVLDSAGRYGGMEAAVNTANIASTQIDQD